MSYSFLRQSNSFLTILSICSGLIATRLAPPGLYNIGGNEAISDSPPVHTKKVVNFPDEDERTKFYTGRWHRLTEYTQEGLIIARQELCKISKSTNREAPLKRFDAVQFLSKYEIERCRGQNYCDDAILLFDSGLPFTHVLVQFGDRPDVVYNLPFITKLRERQNPRGILWPLNAERHYSLMKAVETDDCSWEDKMNKLVWRGADTSYTRERETLVRKFWDESPHEDVDIAFGPAILRSENKPFSRPALSPGQMMKYKYLLALDGNDVPSGLKWMLYSKSVVFMPETRFETWGLESFLLPFVHYVPVFHDLSNLPEQILWAKRNDAACRKISEQATEFITHFREYASQDRRASAETHLKQRILETYIKAMSEVMSNFTTEDCLDP